MGLYIVKLDFYLKNVYFGLKRPKMQAWPLWSESEWKFSINECSIVSHSPFEFQWFLGVLHSESGFFASKTINLTLTARNRPNIRGKPVILLDHFTISLYHILLPYSFTIYFYQILLPHYFTLSIYHIYLPDPFIISFTISFYHFLLPYPFTIFFYYIRLPDPFSISF